MKPGVDEETTVTEAKTLEFHEEHIKGLQREAEEPGRGKWQTRRLVDPQPFDAFMPTPRDDWRILDSYFDRDRKERILVPPLKPGDLVAVQESFAKPFEGPNGYIFRADADEYLGRYHGKHRWSAKNDNLWSPAFELPIEASRLTLEILNVRLQRLNGISEHDAIAEGYYRPRCDADPAARTAFLFGRWASKYRNTNPLVWVYEFGVHACNIAELIKARQANA